MRHSLASRECPMGSQVADNHGDKTRAIQPAVVLPNLSQTLLLVLVSLLFTLLAHERLDFFGDRCQDAVEFCFFPNCRCFLLWLPPLLDRRRDL